MLGRNDLVVKRRTAIASLWFSLSRNQDRGFHHGTLRCWDTDLSRRANYLNWIKETAAKGITSFAPACANLTELLPGITA